MTVKGKQFPILRKAIILFSDGEDLGSANYLDGAIEAAQRADTLVYSIRFGADASASPALGVPMGRGRRFPGPGSAPGRGANRPDGKGANRPDGKKVLKEISGKTGGGYFEAGNASELDKTYARIEDELRNQYNLGYTSDRPGARYHALKVTAKRQNVTVHARQGYYEK